MTIKTELKIYKAIITAMAVSVLGGLGMGISYFSHYDEMEQSRFESTMYDMSLALTGSSKRIIRQRPVVDPAITANREAAVPSTDKFAESGQFDAVTTIEPGVGDDIINLYRQYSNVVPKQFVQAVIDDGWKIELTNLDAANGVSDNLYHISSADFENKVIRLAGSQRGAISLLHELGHVFAMEYAVDELTDAGITTIMYPEFDKAYSRIGYDSPYIYMNRDEIEASLFYDFLLYPEEMQASVPTIYQCYTDAMSNI